MKKTWVRSKKNRVFVCGYCNWCNKELLNTMGGWIINAQHKHFCHDGKDGSCFDQYCHSKKPIEAIRESSKAKDDLGYRQNNSLKSDSPRVFK